MCYTQTSKNINLLVANQYMRATKTCRSEQPWSWSCFVLFIAIAYCRARYHCCVATDSTWWINQHQQSRVRQSRTTSNPIDKICCERLENCWAWTAAYSISPLKDGCSGTLRNDGWFTWIIYISGSLWTVGGSSVDISGLFRENWNHPWGLMDGIYI